jgi:hypothetical protein
VRHTSDKEETAVWIVLSAVWFIASFSAWLAALSGMVSTDTISGDKLILLACLLGGVSLALRLPVLTSTPVTTCFTNQIVWLLTLAANVNWLGCLSLRAESWFDALPAVVALVAGEVWVHRRVDRQACLPDVCASLAALRPSFWLPTNRTQSVDGPPPKLTEHFDLPKMSAAFASVDSAVLVPTRQVGTATGRDEARETAESTESVESTEWLRQTFAGIDDAGQPYLSGEIRVELEPMQTTASIVVAFSPAFAGTPLVELESELLESEMLESAADEAAEFGSAHQTDRAGERSLLAENNNSDASAEELIVQLTTCTPAGMRLALRRSAAAAASRRIYMLRWYASLSSDAAQPASSAANSAANNSSLP